MSLIIPANSASAAGGYAVDNSCRFNPADSAYMHKTPDAGDRQKATFSCWVKRSLITSAQTLFWSGSDNSNYQTFPRFLANDKIVVGEINSGSTTWEIFTNRVFRDTSAWYHIVVAMDTTQGTAANRVKIYVNGVQETSLNIDGGYPAEDRNTLINTAVPHQIAHDYVAQYYGGYVAEACFIEGSQNAPTDFGEFDEDSGIWKPIDVSGLTFGTNGFYLDFKDSANLGNDANGGTDLTEVNLAAIDQSTDTCTNNFCTMNALDNFYAASTLSEGNLKVLTISGNAAYNPATFGLTKGKWYWEVKLVTCSAGDDSEATIFGISNQSPVNAGYDGSIQIGDGFGLRGNGNIWSSSGTVYGWNTVAVGNIVSVAVDFDNGKFYTATNGTYGNSSNPSTASNGYSFTVGTDAWFPGVNQRETSQTGTFELNFGSPPYAISSGNTDGDGYGNFEYAVPSGYYSLNTKNLAEFG